MNRENYIRNASLRYLGLYSRRKGWRTNRVHRAIKNGISSIPKPHTPAVFAGNPSEILWITRKPGKKQNISSLVQKLHEKFNI